MLSNCTHKKFVKTPQDNGDPLTYLPDLVAAMINIDSKRTFRDEIALSGLLRKTPVLEKDTTNPISTEAKKQMDEYLVLQVEQVDDPWLLLLEKVYKGQVCFELQRSLIGLARNGSMQIGKLP